MTSMIINTIAIIFHVSSGDGSGSKSKNKSLRKVCFSEHLFYTILPLIVCGGTAGELWSAIFEKKKHHCRFLFIAGGGKQVERFCLKGVCNRKYSDHTLNLNRVIRVNNNYESNVSNIQKES